MRVVIPCHSDSTAFNTIQTFCRYFSDVGVPFRLHTDSGPQFSTHRLSRVPETVGSPPLCFFTTLPQSNGHASYASDRQGRTFLERRLRRVHLWSLGTGEHPKVTDRSPAQILYGHLLRSCFPFHPQSFSKEWPAKAEDCNLRAAARAE